MIQNTSFTVQNINKISELDDGIESETSLENPNSIHYGPHLPEAFLKVVPHPRSMNQISLIIPLVGNSQANSSAISYIPPPDDRPWAPFRTLEDFEVTEIAVTSLMPRTTINKLLTGVTGKWSDGKCRVTLKKYSDMDAVMFKARKYIVQVRVSYFMYFNDLPHLLSVQT